MLNQCLSSYLSFYCPLSEIGKGWHPAHAEDDLEYLLLYTEQRFLSDNREYWYQGYAVKDKPTQEG